MDCGFIGAKALTWPMLYCPLSTLHSETNLFETQKIFIEEDALWNIVCENIGHFVQRSINQCATQHIPYQKCFKIVMYHSVCNLGIWQFNCKILKHLETHFNKRYTTQLCKLPVFFAWTIPAKSGTGIVGVKIVTRYDHSITNRSLWDMVIISKI